MSKKIQGALTHYTPGSVREAWRMIFPIMLTAASASLMIFFDRLILAQYSTDAMTAVASAGMVFATFNFSIVSLVAIAEVFVGQYNGSYNYKKVGQSVWQMIWLSILASLLFIPLGLFTGEFFVADPYDTLGVPYFKWLMLFGSFFCIEAALAGFFVGIGKPQIVTWVTVIGNIINLVLDIILVFGIEGWIPSMGTTGAAIASGIAVLFQTAILGYLFLSAPNRNKYHTWDFSYVPKLFTKELKVGLPSALSHMIEIAAWAVQLNMMAKAGELHITVVAIAQTVFLLFMFISDGLNKGMSTIAANYMGAGRYDIIPKSLYSTLKIQVYFIAFISLFLIIYPAPILEGFIEGDYSPGFLAQLEYYSRWALVWVWVYMLVDGIVWIFAGILTAAGDTKFIMYANAFNAWFVGIIPLYVWVIIYHGSPASAWFCIALYGSFNCLCFFWRYKMGAWKENRIQS